MTDPGVESSIFQGPSYQPVRVVFLIHAARLRDHGIAYESST